MGQRAKAGTSLHALIAIAIPVFKEAERCCPRTGPGRKPEIPDWVLGVLIMVVVLKRRKSKSAQYRFLEQHWSSLQPSLDGARLPARSTYFARYRRAHQLFRVAVQLQGRKALEEKVASAACVAVDKSLLEARGPAWHQRQRAQGIVPRGVDRDSTWSYSEHHGWVQGYGLEVVVTAGKDGVALPLLAGVETAKRRESQTFLEKIPDLPRGVKHVLADSGYDTNDIAEAIEWTPEGRRTGCRFLCRQVKQGRLAKKRWRETHRRRQRRARREARARYFENPRARKLYRRRGARIEPFHQWFQTLFHLDEHVWHYDLDNNRPQILAALFCYQLLLRYNHRQKRHHAQIQWILDGL
jgi:hypothetical protein